MIQVLTDMRVAIRNFLSDPPDQERKACVFSTAGTAIMVIVAGALYLRSKPDLELIESVKRAADQHRLLWDRCPIRHLAQPMPNHAFEQSHRLFAEINGIPHLIDGHSGVIQIWNLQTLEKVSQLGAHSQNPYMLAFVEWEGVPYLTGALETGQVSVWNLDSQVRIHQFSFDGGLYSLVARQGRPEVVLVRSGQRMLGAKLPRIKLLTGEVADSAIFYAIPDSPGRLIYANTKEMYMEYPSGDVFRLGWFTFKPIAKKWDQSLICSAGGKHYLFLGGHEGKWFFRDLSAGGWDYGYGKEAGTINLVDRVAQGFPDNIRWYAKCNWYGSCGLVAAAASLQIWHWHIRPRPPSVPNRQIRV